MTVAISGGPERDAHGDLLRLAVLLDRFAAFLARTGETRWADWVSADADRLRAGDDGGVDHFLSAFGGMGSINDLIFPAQPSKNRRELRRERDELAETAYELAKALQRARLTSDSDNSVG